jgi:D-amino peptidase
MKLLIAADMEGISGVGNWNDVTPGSEEWRRFRHVMTQDINAAIEGAVQGGASEIVVCDGHWNGTNILIEELDPRASLNSGSSPSLSMVEGVDQNVDAVFFVGYHARHGTLNAILDHTWSNVRITNLWLNGRLTGEFGLNGAVCGSYDVPVILVSGDQSVCAEALEWVPDIETVQVKTAHGRQSAEFLSLRTSQEKIRIGAKDAVSRFIAGKGSAVIHLQTPVMVKVEYANTLMADQASKMPGSMRIDGRAIEFSAESILAAYLGFRTAVNLVPL